MTPQYHHRCRHYSLKNFHTPPFPRGRLALLTRLTLSTPTSSSSSSSCVVTETGLFINIRLVPDPLFVVYPRPGSVFKKTLSSYSRRRRQTNRPTRPSIFSASISFPWSYGSQYCPSGAVLCPILWPSTSSSNALPGFHPATLIRLPFLEKRGKKKRNSC